MSGIPEIREGSIRPLESLKEAVLNPTDRTRLFGRGEPLSQFTSLWMILSEAMAIDELFKGCFLGIKARLPSVLGPPGSAPEARLVWRGCNFSALPLLPVPIGALHLDL